MPHHEKEVNMKKRVRRRSTAKCNGAIHTVFAQTTIILLPKDAPFMRNDVSRR